ncbi:MAG: BrnT family toxin [Prevotellaceae bacterium]|jgi:uncharacterized DUF497 family protein|nr:BrnT family toxin [Prevotellaceae bacterium]
MTFEWDESKRLSNLAKHGIDFADTRGVFYDKHKLDIPDIRHDYGEERKITVGKILDELITAVVSTDRNNNIRIISARRANKKEKEKYYGNC